VEKIILSRACVGSADSKIIKVIKINRIIFLTCAGRCPGNHYVGISVNSTILNISETYFLSKISLCVRAITNDYTDLDIIRFVMLSIKIHEFALPYIENIQIWTEFVISPYPQMNSTCISPAWHIRQKYSRVGDVS